MRNGLDQQDGADILAAERIVQRTEVCGRIPSSVTASELLLHLARVVAIAKRLRLERADPNAPSENCSRCAYIEREYGAEAVV